MPATTTWMGDPLRLCGGAPGNPSRGKYLSALCGIPTIATVIEFYLSCVDHMGVTHGCKTRKVYLTNRSGASRGDCAVRAVLGYTLQSCEYLPSATTTAAAAAPTMHSCNNLPITHADAA